MPFDAGSISGSIDLDTGKYNSSFDGAIAKAETGSAQLRDEMGRFVSGTEESLGHAGETLRSFAEKFAALGEIELPESIFSLEAVAGLLESTAGRFDQIGLESQKLGVPVEWFSRMSEAAKLAHLDASNLAQAFVLLNRNIGEVADGTDKQGAAAFAKLGIRSDDLRQHLNDTRWVIDSVIDGLDRIPTAAQRTEVLRDLFGRAGAQLIPFFEMGRKEIDAAGDRAAAFGAVVTEQSVKAGEALHRLQVEFGQMLEGLSADIALPALESIEKNLPALEQGLLQFAKIASQDILIAITAMGDAFKSLGQFIHDYLPIVEDAWRGLGKLADSLIVADAAAHAIKDNNLPRGTSAHNEQEGGYGIHVPAPTPVRDLAAFEQGSEQQEILQALRDGATDAARTRLRTLADETNQQYRTDVAAGDTAGAEKLQDQWDFFQRDYERLLGAVKEGVKQGYSESHPASNVGETFSAALGSQSGGSFAPSPAAQPATGAGNAPRITVNVNYDARESSRQLGDKIAAAIRRALDAQDAKARGAIEASMVSAALGGI